MAGRFVQPVASYAPAWLFCHKSSGAHPALHPFPTRRSSDPRAPASTEIGVDRWVSEADERRERGGLGRSEEHTSELQSRVDLVCRLLLEKKKPPPRSTRSPRATKRDARQRRLHPRKSQSLGH